VPHVPKDGKGDRQQDALFDADRNNRRSGSQGEIKLPWAFAANIAQTLIPTAIVNTILANTQRGRY
jgi:hypothetical protein